MTRVDDFAPIGDYAALGDGRTVALVARDGRVDWWPLPTLDSPPAFAALLDPEGGGYVALAPEPGSVAEVNRRYRPDTNVLETTYTTAEGSVRVTDALDVGSMGLLPWNELARRVEGLTGQVRMRWAVVPGSRFGSASPWGVRRDGTTVFHVGDQHLALRSFDIGEPSVDGHSAAGSFTTEPGSRHLLAVVGTDDEPVFLPERGDVERRLDRTVVAWQRWADDLVDVGESREAVRRSAFALKLLLFAPTGAIAAAPTTSLPEALGGSLNWDYRFAWVRDSSFVLDALIRLGLHEEVHGAVSWLLGTIRGTPGDLRPFFKLDGRLAEDEETVDVEGYRHSRPVRVGNRATSQVQLGSYGDLFDTVHRYVREGHAVDVRTGRLLADLIDQCCDRWRRPDAGMWELPQTEHYTISKIGCWTALDRAVQLAEGGSLPDGHLDRWRLERDDVRAWVNEHCWSEEKQSYTMHAGTDDLDAATLLAARVGFDCGERLAGTLDAVRAELGRGPLVYRYSGAVGKEGAFLACSFWQVIAQAQLGRLEEARTTMRDLVDLTNDVGLLAEEMDPDTHEMLGNVPQGLSHLALVNAAFTLADCSASAGQGTQGDA